MKVTALTMKNLSHGTPCAVKAACTVWTGAKGSKESDLSVFLFRYEYSANFFYKLWKRIRKYNGLVTGLTQNVDELLRSDTARLMLANSEFLVMLNRPRGTGEVAEHFRQPAWLRHQRSCRLWTDSLRGQYRTFHKFFPQKY